MEMSTVFSICFTCCLLLTATLSAPVPAAETVKELEHRLEELTKQLHLLEENEIHDRSRRATGNVLNENQVPKRSCKEILDDDSAAVDGLYKTAPTDNKGEFTVYCDMTTNGGGWTVIQRRENNSTDFYREWQEYKTGFGKMDGNFWLGLEKIHRITQIENHELLVTMTDHNTGSFIAEYNLFKVDSAATDYQLDIGSYTSTGKDAAGDSLSIHDNQKFTTSDKDNDKKTGENCAVTFHGAWWYNDCHETNLNGKYYYGNYGNYDKSMPPAVADGVVWHTAAGFWHSLKTVTMAIRPII